MNLKNKIFFEILSISIVALIITTYDSSTVQSAFLTTFAEENQTGTENEAKVKADIEQVNKCKKDTECENENKINNEISIVNNTQTETRTGQLTVIKEVICHDDINGNEFTNTVLQEQAF